MFDFLWFCCSWLFSLRFPSTLCSKKCNPYSIRASHCKEKKKNRPAVLAPRECGHRTRGCSGWEGCRRPIRSAVDPVEDRDRSGGSGTVYHSHDNRPTIPPSPANRSFALREGSYNGLPADRPRMGPHSGREPECVHRHDPDKSYAITE